VILFLILFLAVVGTAVYWHFFRQTTNNGLSSLNHATAADEQKRFGQVINKSLQSGDVENYQLSQLELANSYLNEKNYSGAEKLLADVQQNVPAGQLNLLYYQLKVQIDQHNGDNQALQADQAKLTSLEKALVQPAPSS
jgi:hypothetical protein